MSDNDRGAAVPLDGDRLDALERLAEAQAAHKAARYAGSIEAFDKADEALEDAIGTFVARVDLTAFAAEVRASRAEVERLTRDNAELRAVRDGEVLVQGSWFLRAELSTVLDNVMRSSDQHAREAKEAHILLDEARAALADVDRTLAEIKNVANEHATGGYSSYHRGARVAALDDLAAASRTGAADKENDR